MDTIAEKLLRHPYLYSMTRKFRRPMHLSAPLPKGLNPFPVTLQLALAHGELRTIKEAVAWHIITEKIMAGELHPGVTAIDATSGGTGRAYAGILQPLGINLKLIVQGTMPAGKLNQLRVYGQGVEVVSHFGSESTVQRARREAKESGYVLLDQYANEANPEAHEKWLAPGVHSQTEDNLAAIVIPLGTCGTALGFSRYFKKINPSIRIIGVAVDPDTTGGKVSQIPGMRTPAEIERDVQLVKLPSLAIIDQVRLATRSSAVLGARRLMYAEPSGAGLSTGAAYMQALGFIEENLGWLNGLSVIVISPDSIDSYLDIMNAEQDDAVVARALSDRPSF